MDDVRITLRCPKCGNHAQEKFTGDHRTEKVTCGVCSHVAYGAEFIDAASRKRILEATKKAAINKLKKLPGFK